MQTVNDRKQLDEYIRQFGIRKMFSGELPPMYLLRYAPGEMLTTPFSPSGYIQYVVKGDLLLYDMPDESTTITLETAYHHLTILGDVELIDPQFVPFFVEAKTEVYTLAIHREAERERLLNDAVFLRQLCYSLADKLQGATREKSMMTLESKVRRSLLFAEPGTEIREIARLAKSLNASNRQLLRVLKDLCAKGVLSHEKKGVYRVL